MGGWVVGGRPNLMLAPGSGHRVKVTKYEPEKARESLSEPELDNYLCWPGCRRAHGSQTRPAAPPLSCPWCPHTGAGHCLMSRRDCPGAGMRGEAGTRGRQSPDTTWGNEICMNGILNWIDYCILLVFISVWKEFILVRKFAVRKNIEFMKD